MFNYDLNKNLRYKPKDTPTFLFFYQAYREILYYQFMNPY